MRPVAVFTVAALIVTLTGCTTSGVVTNADCDVAAQPGNLSNSVSVSAEAGTVPQATFPLPLRSTEIERTVLTKGTGDTVETGDLVLFDYSMYEGTTGEKLGTSFQEGGTPATQLLTESAGMALYSGLSCQTIGSRLVLTAPVAQILGDEAAAQFLPTLGKNATIVVVLDIVDRVLGRAAGSPRDLPNGFPVVTNTPDGRPGVTVPSVKAPDTLLSATRIQSTLPEDEQEVVASDSALILQVLAISWDNRTVISSTWEDGTPGNFASGTELPYIDGLTGKKAGDQVVVVTPGPNSMIYVVDILGAYPAQG
ncbi:FKBP-type peptidyl-prolyl cis-trans isomerase [Klugiella xanthotipulae]|uniref:hypothetical protein n=1 Tax=Klugiella xanthotipulae TaxID=244735 RepID=UPI00115080F5|nr:hypothetical protein [Klugiella xanthotipulae]